MCGFAITSVAHLQVQDGEEKNQSCMLWQHTR